MSSWEKDLDKLVGRHNAEYEALEVAHLRDYIKLCKKHGRQPMLNNQRMEQARREGLL